MSYGYLIIYKGPSEKIREALGDVATVTRHLNDAFPGLEWKSATKAALSETDFTLKLGVVSGSVFSVTMGVRKVPLKRLADICKQEQWRLEDSDVGDNVALDDPDGWVYRQHAQDLA
jgi:hypothetical protein